MPPLQRELPPKEPTPEQQQQSDERREKADELCIVMFTLLASPVVRKRGGLFRPPELRSGTAEYPLEGEPESRKMRAWVQPTPLFFGEVELVTQVVDIHKDKVVRSESPQIRAHTHRGQLSPLSYNEAYYSHEEKMAALESISDTLALIAEASQQARESQQG